MKIPAAVTCIWNIVTDSHKNNCKKLRILQSHVFNLSTDLRIRLKLTTDINYIKEIIKVTSDPKHNICILTVVYLKLLSILLGCVGNLSEQLFLEEDMRTSTELALMNS